MAKLTAISGIPDDRHFFLKSENTSIGRQHDCDIVLNVDTVSRQHARLFCIGKQYYIEDLNSHNGTFVNNRRLAKPVAIHDNDNIRIGSVFLRFEIENSPDLNSAPDTVSTTDPTPPVHIQADPDPTGTVIVNSVTLHKSPVHDEPIIKIQEKLNAILEVLHNLTGSVNLDQILPCLLDTLFKIFPKADRGFIVIKNSNGELIPKWYKLRLQTEHTPKVSISRMIIEHALSQKAAILSEDAGHDQRFDASESIVSFKIHSVICAPLIDNDGNPFGVIQLDSLKPGQRFQADDLLMLAGMAAPAALAINYAHLYEQALEQQRIQHDLELAHQIQKSFLPGQPPVLNNYEFYHYYQAANKIGGDYFDYISLPDQTLVIIIADVVGHGIAAALLMAKLSSHIAYSLKSQSHPEAIMQTLNQSFCRDNPDDHFVTLVMIILNPDKHTLTIVNAGHMAPFVKRRNGMIERIGAEATGLPLGVMENTEYQQVDTSLSPDEMILLNTDGINETEDVQGRFYGEQAISDLMATQSGSATELGSTLIEDLNTYRQGKPNLDDICLVCFSRSA